MTHEDFSREEHIQGSSDRSFGLVMAAFFGLIGLLPLVSTREPRWWALAVATAFALAAWLRPQTLSRLNALWMKLGLLLSRVVTPVVLGLLFFVTVTPIALLMRLLGKDPLRLRRDPKAASYWITRAPSNPESSSMKNQF